MFDRGRPARLFYVTWSLASHSCLSIGALGVRGVLRAVWLFGFHLL